MATVEERREKKRVATDRYVNANFTYTNRVFETYLPFLVGIRDGTCTGINTAARQITVKLDAGPNDTRQPAVPVAWDRERLTESEVVDHRVKVFVPRQGGQMVLAAITS